MLEGTKDQSDRLKGQCPVSHCWKVASSCCSTVTPAGEMAAVQHVEVMLHSDRYKKEKR